MAVAIPLIGAFASISSGMAAVGTVAGFLQVAGGVLTGLGALTGKKDVMKVGAIMGLGGAAYGAMSGSASAAGSAAGEGAASSVEAADSLRTVENASRGSLAEQAALRSGTQGSNVGTIGGEVAQAAAPDSWSIAEQARARMAPGAPPTAAEAAGMASQPQQVASQYVDPVTSAGSRYTADSLQTMLDAGWKKTQQIAGGVGKFVRDNKEAIDIGGGILTGMLGPQAEQMDLTKSILARRLRNMNNQVALGRTGG